MTETAEDKKQNPATDEIATISKDIDLFAGWLKRLENPDPVLRTEAAGKGLKLYDEVDRDAHAGSVLQQRILAVVGKEWEIIPARSGKKTGRPTTITREQVVADFVSSVLENCNFDQARQEILKAILYGYYTAEVLWIHDRGALKIRKLIGKHPRRFSFTIERELRLLTPSNMIEGEPVPDRKFVVFTYGDSDNPYGRGLGQKLWWPVWFKKHGVKFWLIFLEKFSQPIVKGKYPPGTTPEQQQKLMDAIDAIQTDTGIKIPDSMDISFLEASRAGTVTYKELCDYMDRQITKAVLGQTASTEGTPGKLGNEKAQENVRQEIIEADADLLDSCLNETLIRWIVDYNFPAGTDYPKIVTYARPKPDLTAQIKIDKTAVVDIGVKIPARYFYETYGWPEPADDEEIVSSVGGDQGKIFKYHMDYRVATINEIRKRLGLPPIPGGDVPLRPPSFPGTEFSEKTGAGIADRIVELAAENAMKTTDAVYMAPLIRLVETATDMEDLRDRILDLWGEMPPDDLGTIMAHGMMLAEMSGRYEILLEGSKKKA